MADELLVEPGNSLGATMLKIAFRVLLLWMRRDPEKQADRLAALGVDRFETLIASLETTTVVSTGDPEAV